MISLPMFLALTDPFDRLASEVETEFRRDDCSGLAQCFTEAKEAEFHWKSRIAERHLGSHNSFDEVQLKLHRVAVIGLLNGRWFAAICLVDGNGEVEEMLWKRRCDRQSEARGAFLSAR